MGGGPAAWTAERRTEVHEKTAPTVTQPAAMVIAPPSGEFHSDPSFLSTWKTFDDCAHDAMLRAAVEREFQIIGEAISQLANLDPQIASAISEFRRIIAFRNILIHGYADVDNTLVWDIVETQLPLLKKEVEALLRDGS